MATSGGQPGNNNAGRNKPWRAAIDRAIAQGDPNRLRNIAERLLAKAEEGDIQALKEIGDRLDGRAAQTIAATVDAEVTIVNRNPLSGS